MARIIYNPIFTKAEFEKIKAGVSISDVFIGNLDYSPKDSYIKKSFHVKQQTKTITSGDTIYLSIDNKEKPKKKFPYRKFNQALKAKSSFVTKTPIQRIKQTSYDQEKIIKLLIDNGYKEMVLSHHSFWTPVIDVPEIPIEDR